MANTLSSIAVALAKLGFKKSAAVVTAASINALGLPCPWNPTTNVATLPGGGTINLAANSAPSGDNAFYASAAGTLTTPLQLATGGTLSSVNLNDIVYWTGTGWNILLASANGTIGKLLLKGDGNGGMTNAVVGGNGGDYAPGVTLQTGVPLVVAPPGNIGPNGFLTIPGPWIFTNVSTFLTGVTTYYSTGAWAWFCGGAVTPQSPAGLYWIQMGYSGVMSGTITAGGTGYTNGTYTNVPMTNVSGTGTGALANITVAGGVVTVVTITVQGSGYALSNSLSCAAASIGGTGSGLVFQVGTLNAYVTSGIATYTITTAGTGYANGTYYNVPMTATSGTGVGAQATITVVGGVISIVTAQIQGIGYAVGNTLSIPALGGSGSGAVLTVATAGGPMTGTVYANTYSPTVNSGAWASGNLSFNPPAAPIAVSHPTGGGFYGSATVATNGITLAAIKITGGTLGNNGSVHGKFFYQAMSSTFTKNANINFSNAIQGTPSYQGAVLGASAGLTTTLRQSTSGEWYNRGVPNVQICGPQDIQAAAGSSFGYSVVPTASDIYARMYVWNNTATGVYMQQGTISGGTGYTPGVYTNVPLTGGAGTGAKATVGVSAAGNVVSVVVTNYGTGYAVNTTFSATAANLGGTGSGFQFITSGGWATTPGSGYTDGTYGNVALTGGTGTGAVANITVLSGAVIAMTIVNPGSGFVAGDILSAPAAKIGSGGTGFAYTLGTSLCAPDWHAIESLSIQVNPAA